MSQTEQILKHLKGGRSITALEALITYNCFRLGARIWELKQMGYAVESHIIKRNGKRFSLYRLAEVKDVSTRV